MTPHDELEYYEATEAQELIQLLRTIRPPIRAVRVPTPVDIAIRAKIWEAQVWRQVLTLLPMARWEVIQVIQQAFTDNSWLEEIAPTEDEDTLADEEYTLRLTPSAADIIDDAKLYDSIWQECVPSDWASKALPSQISEEPCASAPPAAIVPDVIVEKVGQAYRVCLNDEGIPRLCISQTSRRLRGERHLEPPEAKRYLDDKLRTAIWLIRSLEHRRQTLSTVAQSLVIFQREFLDHGLAHLKPLALTDVAETIGMHESIVSRVIANKYLATAHGIVALGQLVRTVQAPPDVVAQTSAKADQQPVRRPKRLAWLGRLPWGVDVAAAAVLVLALVGAVPHYRTWFHTYVRGVPSEMVLGHHIIHEPTDDLLLEGKEVAPTKNKDAPSDWAVTVADHMAKALSESKGVALSERVARSPRMASVDTALLLAAETVEAARTDLREHSDYTAEDIAKRLFPEIRMREIGPAEVRRAVALNVLFEAGSTTIAPQFYPDIDKIGKVLSLPQYAQYRFEIAGHTDSTGSASYNQSVSRRRAESVKRYLVQHFHISPERLIVKGYGEAQPLTTNNTSVGRNLNRRVELVNLGKG
jgi:outer membrane protein OmpA-like peptidoglycan-associated protein